MVERQSSPVRNPLTFVSPSAMEPSITLLWDMDLSPGTVIVPLRFFDGFITAFILSFLYGYIIVHISEKLYAAHTVFFRIKGKGKGTAVVFAAVDNAHIFYVYSVA